MLKYRIDTEYSVCASVLLLYMRNIICTYICRNGEEMVGKNQELRKTTRPARRP